MIVARREVGHQGAERIERCFMTQLDFFFDLQLDLVQGNMPRPLDHHLHIIFPGYFRQLAQRFQFRELRFVAGVGD